MTSSRHAYVAVLLATSAVAACYSADNDEDDDGGASAGSAGRGGSGGKGGSSSSGGSAGEPGEITCESYGFVTNGAECPSSGCSPVYCDCPDDFPISLNSCSPDGCLLAADCDVVCGAGLGEALDCTDTYTVDPNLGMGGSAGAGGTGGSGGAPPEPTCEASDVTVSPAAHWQLPGSARGQAVISDAAGATYIAGELPDDEAIDFGGGELEGAQGLFVLKLDASGAHVWSRRFGSDFGLQKVTTLSFAADGDLLVGGLTGSTTDLGGGPESEASVPQLFAARYHTDGAFVESYLIPTSNSVPELSAVVEMPDGGLDLWGYFSTEFSVGSTTLNSAGEADVFVVRFSADGAVTDVKQYGDARNDHVYDAVSDAAGNTYLLGFSYYQVNFGANPIDLDGESSSFVVKLGSDLIPAWQELIGGGGSYPRRAELDGTELVVAGDSYSASSYDGIDVPRGNLFVFRIDTADGSGISGNGYETEGYGASLTALSLLADGGLVLGGTISPSNDFGGGLLPDGVNSDPFVARYAANGEHVWSTKFCAVSNAKIQGFGHDADSLLVLADFPGDLTLGSEALTGLSSALLDMPVEE
jgi:hypothetical protein